MSQSRSVLQRGNPDHDGVTNLRVGGERGVAVGGRVQEYLQLWEMDSSDQWVLRVVKNGYSKYILWVSTIMTPLNRWLFWQESRLYWKKRAIIQILKSEQGERASSVLFPVQKASSSFRGVVLDLKVGELMGQDCPIPIGHSSIHNSNDKLLVLSHIHIFTGRLSEHPYPRNSPKIFQFAVGNSHKILSEGFHIKMLASFLSLHHLEWIFLCRCLDNLHIQAPLRE